MEHLMFIYFFNVLKCELAFMLNSKYYIFCLTGDICTQISFLYFESIISIIIYDKIIELHGIFRTLM